jgi:hypothetical protein
MQVKEKQSNVSTWTLRKIYTRKRCSSNMVKIVVKWSFSWLMNVHKMHIVVYEAYQMFPSRFCKIHGRCVTMKVCIAVDLLCDECISEAYIQHNLWM